MTFAKTCRTTFEKFFNSRTKNCRDFSRHECLRSHLIHQDEGTKWPCYRRRPHNIAVGGNKLLTTLFGVLSLSRLDYSTTNHAARHVRAYEARTHSSKKSGKRAAAEGTRNRRWQIYKPAFGLTRDGIPVHHIEIGDQVSSRVVISCCLRCTAWLSAAIARRHVI